MCALCVSGAVNTQGFVWKFFYALYINFHSFIETFPVLGALKVEKEVLGSWVKWIFVYGGGGGGFFYTFVLFVTNVAPVTPHPNPFYDSYNHGPLTLAKRSARNNAARGGLEGGGDIQLYLVHDKYAPTPFPSPPPFSFFSVTTHCPLTLTEKEKI